jgi:DNA-binding MarR family transcriptional regulator
MNSTTSENQGFALAVAAAWNNLERQLDCSLGSIRGVSFAEYRLLRALSEAPDSQASRIDAARSVGLTASGVTRALRPLEKVGLVSTVRNKRDARLAIAKLTPAGHALVKDASSVVNETMTSILERAPKLSAKLGTVSNLLNSLRG